MRINIHTHLPLQDPLISQLHSPVADNSGGEEIGAFSDDISVVAADTTVVAVEAIVLGVTYGGDDTVFDNSVGEGGAKLAWTTRPTKSTNSCIDKLPTVLTDGVSSSH